MEEGWRCTSSDKISSGSKFAGVDGFVGKIGRRDGGNLKTGRFAWDCDTVNRSGVSGLCVIVDVGECIMDGVEGILFLRLSSFFVRGIKFFKIIIRIIYSLR